MQNLRWKIITILAVFVVFAGVGIYPIVAAQYGITSPSWLVDKQLKLGLDLKGGVHLVLRVQTDDALRIETESETERLREALRTPQHSGRPTSPPRRPTEFRVEGVPAEQDAAFRESAVEADTNFNRGSAVGGTYTFTMKPNVQTTLREEAVTQARQTIERRVNELGVTEPSIAEQGDQGDQILVQLPGVTDVNRAKEIIRSTGLLELKIVEQGPSASRESFLQNGQVPQGTEIIPGSSGATGEPGSTVFYLVQAGGRGQRQRPAQRPSVARREQPAGGRLHPERRRRPQVRPRHRREHRPAAGHRPRRPRAVGAGDSGAHYQRGPHQRQLHAGRSAEPVAGPALGRAAGDADLSRRAHHRPVPRRRLDPVGGAGVGRRPGADHHVHADLLQAVGRERGRGADLQPGDPARPDGLHRRGHDAAGHRRLRADDGYRRRLERADFRADQGRARGAARRPRVDQRRLQPRVLDAGRHPRRGADLGGVPVPVRHRRRSAASP